MLYCCARDSSHGRYIFYHVFLLFRLLFFIINWCMILIYLQPFLQFCVLMRELCIILTKHFILKFKIDQLIQQIFYIFFRWRSCPMFLLNFLLQEPYPFSLIIQYNLIFAMNFGLVIFLTTIDTLIETGYNIIHSFVQFA